jgi:steroid delta-isomerase-like uncharacterized protein
MKLSERLYKEDKSMSVEENKEMVRRFMEEVLSQKRLDEIDDYLTEDYVNHLLPPGAPQGPQGEKLLVGQFQQAFPDYTISMERIVGEGDKVMAHWSFRGTNSGEFQGIPATGKQVHVQAINFFRFSDGRIAENRPAFDMLGLLQQIGVVPMPGQGA